jgi:hypothetical protein
MTGATGGCWTGLAECTGAQGNEFFGTSRQPMNPPAHHPSCNETGPLPEKTAADCEAACCASHVCKTWVFNAQQPGTAVLVWTHSLYWHQSPISVPDDIGRNVGTDIEPIPCGTYSPATTWTADSTPMGSSDFQSTRDAIVSNSLRAQPHQEECVQLQLVSNGTSNGDVGYARGETLSNDGGACSHAPSLFCPT